MSSNQIQDVVAAAIQRCRLEGTRVIVAVSGGADSVALLLAIDQLRDRFQLHPHVVHFDHALRADSADDARWVRELATELKFDVTIGRAGDIASGRSVASRSEAGAREARYGFFADVSGRLGASAVLVGHTQNDQSESRLLHLVRGSGLRGLRGMSEDSRVVAGEMASVRVVRPLLGTSREQTEALCAKFEVQPRLDSTNQNIEYARNRIRHQVVPHLTSINPGFVEALERLARVATDADDYIRDELDRRMAEMVRTSDLDWTIDRSLWRPLHPALKRALLRRAAASFNPHHDVGAEAIETAIWHADASGAGVRLEWPGERVVEIDHDSIVVRRSQSHDVQEGAIPVSATASQVLPLPSPNWRKFTNPSGLSWPHSGAPVLKSRLQPTPCEGRDQDRWHMDLDRAKLADTDGLLLRRWRPGDWLLPVGMTGRKKLQDLFVDTHVPRRLRAEVPILATSGNIVWVLGLRRDRRFVARDDSTDILCLDVIAGAPEDKNS